MTSETEEHKAIDFAAANGTPVYASGDGYVEKVIKSDNEYGQTILLRHGAFVESYYAHLSEILVEEGDFVETGSIIGKVGDSGIATTPHLHFDLRQEVDHRSGSLFAQALE
jgi:murein DD-endopeptidase MepM/ murein hydrolase activator NlpD